MIRWEDCICHLHDPVLRIQVKRVMCNFIQAAFFREPSLDQQTDILGIYFDSQPNAHSIPYLLEQ